MNWIEIAGLTWGWRKCLFESTGLGLDNLMDYLVKQYIIDGITYSSFYYI